VFVLYIKRSLEYGSLSQMQRRVKLERDAEGQFIQIPLEFEPLGDNLLMRKEGNKLIIEPAPVPKQSLLELLETWEPLDEEFPQIEDLPPEPLDL
jgi:antitoxin VapB